MLRTARVALLVATLPLAASTAPGATPETPCNSAGPNLVLNPDFESIDGRLDHVPESLRWTSFAPGSERLDGWTLGGDGADLHHFSDWEPASGRWALDLNRDGSGIAAQTIATTPGTAYRLEFALAGNPRCGPDLRELRVTATSDGGATLASVALDWSVSGTGSHAGALAWRRESLELVALDDHLTLAFASLSASPCGPTIDAVSLTALGSCAERTPTRLEWAGDVAADHRDPAWLAARLLDTSTAPEAGIPGEVVELRLGTASCRAPTDGRGIAACAVEARGDVGTSVAPARFTGSFRLAPSEAAAAFTVTAEETAVATRSALAGVAGDFSVAAEPREDGAVPLPGREVTLAAGSEHATAVTSASGRAAVILALTAGDHVLDARHTGDALYETAERSTPLRLLAPVLVLAPRRATHLAGAPATVIATLLDGGQPLAGHEIAFAVVAGPNSGAAGACAAADCRTASDGTVSFTWATSDLRGRDELTARVDPHHPAGSATATAAVHLVRPERTRLEWTGDTTGDHDDPVELAARLTSAESGAALAEARIAFRLGAASCTASTGADGRAACFVRVEGPARTLPAEATLAATRDLEAASASAGFAVTAEETTLTPGPERAFELGQVALSATLGEDGALALPGRPVTFESGTASVTALTDADGRATVALPLPVGRHQVTARFAGDGFHETASPGPFEIIVYRFAPFVVWGGNSPRLDQALTIGDRLEFWGARWEDQVRAGDYAANAAFKGWAAEVATDRRSWLTRPGNSSRPPANIDPFLGVLVSTRIARDGADIRGNGVRIAVLEVERPDAYRPNPGHAGHGRLLAWADHTLDPADIPDAPIAVVAVSGNGAATVTFTPPARSGRGPLTGYLVLAPDGTPFPLPATSAERVVTGLENGVPAAFRVIAVNAFGASAPSAPSAAVVPATVPDAPTVTSLARGDTTLDVEWSVPLFDGGAPVTGYRLEPSPTGTAITVPATATHATLTGLDNGFPHTVVVRALNALGAGPGSDASTPLAPARPPDAPAAVVASAGDGEATLWWSPPDDDGGLAIDEWRIASHPVGPLALVPATSHHATLVGLPNGVAHSFTVTALSAAGASAPSAPSPAVTPAGPPATPRNVRATPGNSTAILRWDLPATDGGAAIEGYVVEVAPAGLIFAAPATDRERLVTGLSNGVAHTFTVRAVNVVGSGPASPPTPGIVPATVPDAPTGVAALDLDAAVSVTWREPAFDGGSPLTGFEISAWPDGRTVVAPPTARTASIAGLRNGQEYVIAVRATNAHGRSPESTPSNPVTPARAPDAPRAPSAVLAGDRAVMIAWLPPLTDGGAEVTSYRVSANPGPVTATVNGKITRARIRGLAASTDYTFTVTALNRKGESAPSAASNIIRAATYPSAPANVVALPGDGAAVVTWTGPASDGGTRILGYRLRAEPGGIELDVAAPATTAVLAGLTNGLIYTVTVSARNAIGLGSASAPSNAVTPVAGARALLARLALTPSAVRGGTPSLLTVALTAPAPAPGVVVTLASADPALASLPANVLIPEAASSADVVVTTAAVTSVTNVPLTASLDAVTLTTSLRLRPQPTGPPPTVALTAPDDAAAIFDFTPVRGTVASPTLESWTLEHRRAAPDGDDREPWTLISSSTTTGTDFPLGLLDPTLALNGLHELRLTATDLSGETASDSRHVLLKGQQKVGPFSLTYVDLTIPIAGLPIQILRRYDSRDRSPGDFGVGWTLALRDADLRVTGVLGQDWEIRRLGAAPFYRYCVSPTRARRVTVTFPDGRVYSFRPRPATACQLLRPPDQVDLVFEPESRPLGKLTAWSGSRLTVLRSTAPGPATIADSTGDPWDPAGFDFTVEDGTRYAISVRDGLQAIHDRLGNTITFTRDGIRSSPSGVEVAFHRDADGRIREIVDPRGNVLRYGIDASGDLESFTDREDRTSRYGYRDHRLETIADPDGRTVVRNLYDSDGRLTDTCDALDRCVHFDHDLAARTETALDRLGNPTRLVYDERGNITEKTDAEGVRFAYRFDGDDRLIAELDALGHETTHTWSTEGFATARKDALGRVSTWTHNEFGQVLTQDEPGGRHSVNTYTPSGNLETSTDPLGRVRSYGYDPHGRLETETDELGNTTSFESDALGNPTRTVHPDGSIERRAYDANGHLAWESIRLSAAEELAFWDDLALRPAIAWHFEHDRNDRRIRETSPTPRDGEPSVVTATTYDPLGRIESRTDGRGTVTRNVHNDLGLLEEIHDAWDTTEVAVTRTAFDDNGRATDRWDADGIHLGHTRIDRAGRELGVSFPDVTSTVIGHDLAGRQDASTDRAGRTTRHELDAIGRRRAVVDPLERRSETLHDDRGFQEYAIDPAGRSTQYVHDALGRLERTIYPDITESRTEHLTWTYVDRHLGQPLAGELRREVDALGRVTEYRHDWAGRLLEVHQWKKQDDPTSLVLTRYEYDLRGNRSAIIDALGRRTEFEHDRLGRLRLKRYPFARAGEGREELHDHDANGNLTKKTLPDGRALVFTYDRHNRLERKELDPPTPGSYQPWIITWTSAGRREKVERGSRVWRWTYSPVTGELETFTDPFDRTITYASDAALATSSVTTALGTTTWSRDPLDRLATITDRFGRDTVYAYVPATGVLDTVTRPNGTVTSYLHDPLDRPKTIEHRISATGDLIARFAYTLGPTGRRDALVESRPAPPPALPPATEDTTVTWNYDDLDRLLGESRSGAYDLAWTYDDGGNRETETRDGVVTHYRYDPRDRLECEGPVLGCGAAPPAVEHGWDPNGNLVARGPDETFEWDPDGRLVRHTTGTGLAARVTEFEYDLHGIRLIERDAMTGVERQFLVDGHRGYAEVLEEWLDDGSSPAPVLAMEYVMASGVERLWQIDHATGAERWFHADALGSTRALSTAAAPPDLPAVAQKFDYEAFGADWAPSGPPESRYRYTAQQADPSTAGYYLRARYMAPATGRFLSEDPFLGDVLLAHGATDYSYARSAPTQHLDPTGLFTFTDVKIAVASMGYLTVNFALTHAQPLTKSLAVVLGGDLPAVGSTPIAYTRVAVRSLPASVPSLRRSWQPMTAGVLRTQAQHMWKALAGAPASLGNLEIHHRIPLEYREYFSQHPNRISNLAAVPRWVHQGINSMWNGFRENMKTRGRKPTPAEIQQFAAVVDEEWGEYYRTLRYAND